MNRKYADYSDEQKRETGNPVRVSGNSVGQANRSMIQFSGFIHLFRMILAAAIVYLLVPCSVSHAAETQEAPARETEETETVTPESIDVSSMFKTPDAIASGFVQLRLIGEFGFLAPVDHKVQFSKAGTRIDYLDEGGQDNLYPTGRITLELRLDKRHNISILYQPLNLATEALMKRDIEVDGLVFPKETGVKFRYGFDFWRFSYMYDFFGDQPFNELSLGFSMQIRNATITFNSTDGTLHRSNRDIGPVPLIKLRGRWQAVGPMWVGGEIDGFYAPIKYINGGSSDVEGAFIDASLRIGVRTIKSLDLFLNFRYLGGGASGTGSDSGPGDGYTYNWLHFLTVSIGVEWSLTDLWREESL